MKSSPHLPFTSTNASVLLDLIRALAALLVCLEHWRALLYVDYGQLAGHKLLFAVPYVMTGAGHQAVVIFFVLSGYLISGSIFRLLQRGEWSWKLYLTHRVVRLWIVLIPALLLGAILDNLGLRLHLAPALYAGKTGTHMLNDISQVLHPAIFVKNMFFLQSIPIHGTRVDTFGTNGPLWSLAYEFWYYILFPCAFLALRKGTAWWKRILNALVFGWCIWFVGRDILMLFPMWLLGALLAALPVPRIGWPARALAAIVYCPLLFFLAKTQLVRGAMSDYILGGATFVFVWLLLGAQSKASAGAGVYLSRVGARFSYTLYLVHVPFLVLLTALLAGNTRWQPVARHLVYGLGALLLVIGYAYAVASVTEFRTDAVRAWVERRLLGRVVRTKVTVPANG
jgi:peptidoglycan/LPS O-acetylase OafA/YrhL